MTYRAWDLKALDRAAVRELTHAIAEQRTEELEYSAMDEEPWSEQKYAATLAAQQKETALLAGILAARGITDPADALTLLAGEEELSDPALLTDMEKACQRIWQAIDNGETIVVFGDYDVDGVTATALLYQHLKGMGAAVKCMLPSREGDGYGLSRNAIQSIHDKGYRLIVTVDNGISAVAEADFAAQLGIDLIITDHHLPPETLPKAVAVVDPRREDDTSPFKGLCGAGVAFKLCAALDDCTPEEMLDYCGDLAAVGTVADVMPLTGENRTLVKAGLRQLQQTDRPGMEALLEEVGLAGKPVTAENISYAIAPRINAAGRMDSAVTALQLVLCEDPDRAEELAHKLNEIMEVADRCTILRKGKYIGTVNISETSKEELSRMMVGRNVSFSVNKKPSKPGDTVLKVEHMTVPSKVHGNNAVKDVSFNVRKGEIVCIAGIDGNGQSEFVQGLTGLEKVSGGKILFNGQDITKASIRDRSKMGMSHIPEDRHKHGLVLDYSIEQNMVLQRYWQPEFESFGFIKSKAVREYAERLIEQYDVRSGQGPVTITRSMSGGNQQKAIIAREIDKDPDLLVAVQPTRGLDVGAIEYIHSQLVAQRDKGKAVLLVSLELDEVMDVSDRILVMYEGELVGQLDPKTVSVEELGLYMAGAKRDPVPEEV